MKALNLPSLRVRHLRAEMRAHAMEVRLAIANNDLHSKSFYMGLAKSYRNLAADEARNPNYDPVTGKPLWRAML